MAAHLTASDGWLVHHVRSVDSTQDLARAAGAPHRSAFVADFQAAGRGRRGRVWRAPPATALLVSLVLRSTERPSFWRSTALTSVALGDSIEALLPTLRPAIKWPNDLLLDGRKVAGILAESTWDGARAELVIGVGVNVTTESADFVGLGNATSLWLASGQRIQRSALLDGLLVRIDHWLARSVDEVRATWQARLWGRGQRVRLADVDGEQEVVILGAESDGSLRVRLTDGAERTTATAEIIL